MKQSGKKIAALVILVSMLGQEAMAFCGFYVSKADGTLHNKTSQVILVRDGDRTVITMYNDFTGDTKDFAMVVPVPVVLEKKDIHVVNQDIFQILNDYSKPRLVEYYDQNPCTPTKYEYMMDSQKALRSEIKSLAAPGTTRKDDRVKIEAQYVVGEYDILILSAKESSGLKTWLDENGYRIPKGAEEVLEPYIRSNLKFFVVKVNEAEKKKLAGDFLRPIQIQFNSPKFMLPIRLGMANADGDQDMLVYAFTKRGRIECTNYRTVALPTGKNIPLFVQDNFGNFYANLFQHQWSREGKSVAMLEYAWDVSPQNYLKCDPCVATAPSVRDLVQAGVWWVNPGNDNNSYQQYNEGDRVFFTRLHVRYNRTSFPQDLVFQVTPNTDNFQARYVITHPATGDLSCAEGQRYLRELRKRRAEELDMLGYLTGKGYNDWDLVEAEDDKQAPPAEADSLTAVHSENRDRHPAWFAAISTLGLLTLVGFSRKRIK